MSEYEEAAMEAGYAAFWQGRDGPAVTLPDTEEEYWWLGWNKAHFELSNPID